MADPSWLLYAKTLPAGQSMRIECCSSDKSMQITNDRRGYRGFCHRCRQPVFEAHGEHSLATLARRRAEFALVQERSVKLPSDFTLEIPTEEATWLFKAGISSEIAKHYGIGWSEYYGRVFVPVYEKGELVAYTARLRVGRPKYIEKSINPGGLIFKADARLLLPSYKDWAYQSGPDRVLVEDNLSAIRVGRLARSVVSLMGTSASSAQLAFALANHEGLRSDGMGRVVVWLDPDVAGQRAAQKLLVQLRLLGYDACNVVSKRDPKYYSYEDMKELLSCPNQERIG